MKIETIINYEQKTDIIYNILNPMPKYFANKFVFEKHINKIKDMHFMAFNLYNQTVAFSVCKEIYDNTTEIYMLGIYEQMQKTDISDKIISAVKRYAGKNKRKYIIAKVPIVVSIRTEGTALFDFYSNHGFTHIANLQAPWDEKRTCMLLITH